MEDTKLGNIPNLSAELDLDQALQVTPRAVGEYHYDDVNQMYTLSGTDAMQINFAQGVQIYPSNTKTYNPLATVRINYQAPQDSNITIVGLRDGITLSCTLQYLGIVLPPWFQNSNISSGNLGNLRAANIVYSWGNYTERRSYTALYTMRNCTFIYQVRDVYNQYMAGNGGGFTIVFGQMDPSASPMALSEISEYEDFIDDV